MKSGFTKLMIAAGLAVGIGGYSISLTVPVAQAQNINANMDWTKGVIKVTGAGAPPATGAMAQKRLMARRAAIADGYRQLAEAINGVRVDAETIVKNYVTESDVVRTQVSALIKGAQIGDTRYMSDGSVEVDMVIGMYGSNSLSSVLQPKLVETYHARPQTQPTAMPTAMPTSAPTPPPETHINITPGGKYSGVIVDCKGLGVKPAMSPSIVDPQGKEVYVGSNVSIDVDFVVNTGIVGYATSLAQAKANARIGNNPLVLRATRAGGKTAVDAVLSADQTGALLSANMAQNFLDSSKVVFVID